MFSTWLGLAYIKINVSFAQYLCCNKNYAVITPQGYTFGFACRLKILYCSINTGGNIFFQQTFILKRACPT